MNKNMISGFADEICSDFETQLSVVQELGMKYICIRGINGRNITDFSLSEAENDIKPLLDRYGIGVSSIGSPIGKVPLNDDSAFHRQLEQLETLCKIAKLLNCRYMRFFSFYIPKDGIPDEYEALVVQKISQIIEVCDRHGIVPMHENEKGIYGDIGVRCRRIHEALRGTTLRAAFDFANFVQCDDQPLSCYALLKEYIDYVHIKDADASTHVNVLFGTGDGQSLEILADLKASGYDGFLTLEPHLVLFSSLKDIELETPENIIRKNNAYADGKAGFTAQYNALVSILEKL